jgi:hypothetical protein
MVSPVLVVLLLVMPPPIVSASCAVKGARLGAYEALPACAP